MVQAAPLSERIKAEFDLRVQRLKAAEQRHATEARDHDVRLARFGMVCDDLRAVWRPRLEEFARQFGDKIKVSPVIEPSRREAKVQFLTDLANMTLTLTASPNADITKLVLDYELLVIL